MGLRPNRLMTTLRTKGPKRSLLIPPWAELDLPVSGVPCPRWDRAPAGRAVRSRGLTLGLLITLLSFRANSTWNVFSDPVSRETAILGARYRAGGVGRKPCGAPTEIEGPFPSPQGGKAWTAPCRVPVGRGA